MQMEVVILKNNYIYEIFWKYKIQKHFNRSLFIDNKVYDISNIPTQFKAPCVQNAT